MTLIGEFSTTLLATEPSITLSMRERLWLGITIKSAPKRSA
ncbi:Uncharacterised protein [Vibrio cholerae]|uniref:Uncharacterized protein n=1 Tax=Vibrio cholerae TaxID=666 RepID=A0A656ACU0_VIBCL|nr:Uncharacterised protein [Vibrio cholerae]